MLESIVLGIIQGITEWLPISSEGALVLIKVNFFRAGATIESLLKESLFLHLGTFFAATLYLRREVVSVFKTLVNYRNQPREQKNLTRFLIISTVVSGAIGILFFKAFTGFAEGFDAGGKIITAAVGVLLLITGIFQIKAGAGGLRNLTGITFFDGMAATRTFTGVTP